MDLLNMIHLSMMIVVPIAATIIAMLKWGITSEKNSLKKDDAANARSSSTNSHRLDKIESRLYEFEISLPANYVQRADWVPQIAVLDSRIERLADTLHELVGEFRATRIALENKL